MSLLPSAVSRISLRFWPLVRVATQQLPEILCDVFAEIAMQFSLRTKNLHLPALQGNHGVRGDVTRFPLQAEIGMIAAALLAYTVLGYLWNDPRAENSAVSFSESASSNVTKSS